jgi:hypothetical protein
MRAASFKLQNHNQQQENILGVCSPNKVQARMSCAEQTFSCNSRFRFNYLRFEAALGDAKPAEELRRVRQETEHEQWEGGWQHPVFACSELAKVLKSESRRATRLISKQFASETKTKAESFAGKSRVKIMSSFG